MSRKSRERMMQGRFETRTGDITYKMPSVIGPQPARPLSAKKRGRMLEYLRAVPEGEREGVCGYLRQDGSEKALALLAELEAGWARTAR